MSVFEIAVLYTDYCDDCYEKGIEPKDPEIWFKEEWSSIG